MTDLSPEFRAQAIKTRRLEIIATLANWKSEYFNQGIEHPKTNGSQSRPRHRAVRPRG